MLYRQPDPQDVLTRHGNASSRALAREFTVCVWNWQKTRRKNWTAVFRSLAAQTDLFLAQEVRRSPAVLREMNAAPLCWSGAVSFFSLGNQYPTGVATGCVAEPEQTAFRAGAREPFLHVPKMVLAAVFPLEDGRKLLTVNVHAVNFTGSKPFDANMARTAELLAGFDGPVVFGGDFNVWNEKRLQTLFRLTQSTGLTEAIFAPDGRTRYLGRPVDYLFTRGLSILQTSVLQTDASDHRPLTAQLSAQ